MNGGSSSSCIVAVPVPSSSIAPTASESDTENVFEDSWMSSSSNATVIVSMVSPGAKVSVPDVSV